MEVLIGVCIHEMKQSSSLPSAVSVPTSNQVAFKCPPQLRSVGFPVPEASFACNAAFLNPSAASLQKSCFPVDVAQQSIQKRQNLVVYAYGIRSTPRRQLMFGAGSSPGYAGKLIADAVVAGAGKGIFTLSAYVLGHTEKVIDLINMSNEQGSIIESVKEGPKVRGIERTPVRSAADVTQVLSKVVSSYERVFAAVLPEKQPTAELEAFPPYNGDTIILQLHKYDNEEHFAAYSEANSISFIALGDAERPILCGVDVTQQAAYEKTQRILLSVAGIVSSIRCSRLRIPFGKSKLSQLLRRSYNNEKGNPYNTINAPTRTILLVHCFSDGNRSEESYHALSMTQRVSNMLGSTGIGSLLRDLTVEKWRLDQDIEELKDELLIAKKVYDYKPCIYESSNPVINIEEEESQRISAIQKKRDEARERQLSMIRQRATEEAARLIREQESKSGTTLAELERTLEQKKKENTSLIKDRDERTKEYEQTLEKMRKKKEEEGISAEALKADISALEEELAQRQQTMQSKQKQLELSQLDKAKGKEAVLHEREGVQAVRKTVTESRRRQRGQWTQQIKEINNKVKDQVQALVEERRRNGDPTSAKDEAAEKAILEDIRSVESFLPKLISLEEVPANVDEIEFLRRQFNEVFSKEKASYQARIEEERARKEKLERGLEAYRNKVLQAAQEKKKENFQNAAAKEQQVMALTDKVLTYLQNGVKMTKVSSQGNLRRRYYFLSEDGKRMHSCELDSRGFPISVKKPPVTVWLKDIKKIVIGTYTPSFMNFSGEEQLAKHRQESVTDQGTYRFGATPSITAVNLGVNNYRAFGLILKGGKTLELVCDSDTDWEGWLIVLKRLLNLRTEIEMQMGDATLNAGATPAKEVMTFGGTLDIRNMKGFLSLSAGEAAFCSEAHVPPALYFRMKKEMTERSHIGLVTVYDIRNESGLDFIRSRALFDFLVKERSISFS